MPMKTQIGFSIYRSGKLVREARFDRPIINIGKLSTSNLRVDDINVSRKHAVIEQRENGDWRVTDLGSTNGTVLHGERVVQSDIKDGDRIVFGTTTIVVHLDQAAAQPSVMSGTAGDLPAAPAPPPPSTSASAGGERAGAPAAPARPAGEIRGLGEESFLKKKLTDTEDEPHTLEIALLWGETVLAVERFDDPLPIEVGERAGCRFAIPQEVLGTSRYELVAVRGGAHALNLANARIEGDVLLDGEVTSLDALREAHDRDKLFPIDRPMRARLRVGEFSLLVTYGPMPKKGTVPTLGDVEVDPWIYIAVSAVLHIGFLILLSLQAPRGGWTERDPHEARERAIEALTVDPEEEEEEEEVEEEEIDPDDVKYSDDATEEERVSFTDTVEIEEVEQTRPTLQDPLLQQQKDREEFDQLSESEQRDRAREMVNDTALADALRENNPLLTDLLSNNPDLLDQQNPYQAIGSQDPDGATDPYAAATVDPFGGTLSPASGGFLASGPATGGPNAGGPAVAGVLDGRDNRRGLRDLEFKDRPADPKIIQMKPRLVGELDAATVQAYIRRYLSGIRWCYQDRLQLKRQLGGKLTLSFTILPNGGVANPQTLNSSVRDSELEGCIVTKMKRWRFPQPKDGGLVEVAYPLILRTQ